MMNKKHSIVTMLGFLCLMLMFSSCGLDNYDAPQSRLHGRIVYKGKPLNLKSTQGAVQLQLYQSGYAKKEPIPVFVNQNGEFSAQLFDGDYKLVTRDGNGPWVNSRDTMYVRVDGHTECELEVTPYFMISDHKFSIDGDLVHGTASIEKIVDDASVEKVIMLVGKTGFIDESINLTQVKINMGNDMKAKARIDMSSVKNYNKSMHLYARIGVRAVGADQYVFTPVVRLK